MRSPAAACRHYLTRLSTVTRAWCFRCVIKQYATYRYRIHKGVGWHVDIYSSLVGSLGGDFFDGLRLECALPHPDDAVDLPALLDEKAFRRDIAVHDDIAAKRLLVQEG